MKSWETLRHLRKMNRNTVSVNIGTPCSFRDCGFRGMAFRSHLPQQVCQGQVPHPRGHLHLLGALSVRALCPCHRFSERMSPREGPTLRPADEGVQLQFTTDMAASAVCLCRPRLWRHGCLCSLSQAVSSAATDASFFSELHEAACALCVNTSALCHALHFCRYAVKNYPDNKYLGRRPIVDGKVI